MQGKRDLLLRKCHARSTIGMVIEFLLHVSNVACAVKGRGIKKKSLQNEIFIRFYR